MITTASCLTLCSELCESLNQVIKTQQIRSLLMPLSSLFLSNSTHTQKYSFGISVICFVFLFVCLFGCFFFHILTRIWLVMIRRVHVVDIVIIRQFNASVSGDSPGCFPQLHLMTDRYTPNHDLSRKLFPELCHSLYNMIKGAFDNFSNCLFLLETSADLQRCVDFSLNGQFCMVP